MLWFLSALYRKLIYAFCNQFVCRKSQPFSTNNVNQKSYVRKILTFKSYVDFFRLKIRGNVSDYENISWQIFTKLNWFESIFIKLYSVHCSASLSTSAALSRQAGLRDYLWHIIFNNLVHKIYFSLWI